MCLGLEICRIPSTWYKQISFIFILFLCMLKQDAYNSWRYVPGKMPKLGSTWFEKHPMYRDVQQELYILETQG